jgi:hypothetical protein
VLDRIRVGAIADADGNVQSVPIRPRRTRA